jgi:hypothetical protein
MKTAKRRDVQRGERGKVPHVGAWRWFGRRPGGKSPALAPIRGLLAVLKRS